MPARELKNCRIDKITKKEGSLKFKSLMHQSYSNSFESIFHANDEHHCGIFKMILRNPMKDMVLYQFYGSINVFYKLIVFTISKTSVSHRQFKPGKGVVT